MTHHAEEPGSLSCDTNEPCVAREAPSLPRPGLRAREIFVVPVNEPTSEKERRTITGSRRFNTVQCCPCRGGITRREVCARLPDPK
jgi:hypothetical protein